MRRFVVLLKGVNVGKGNRVPMSGFKALLEGLGFAEVRTLLNSGNAVFTAAGRSGAARHAGAIAAAVEDAFGVSTPVIVKTADALARIVAGNPLAPLPAAEHARCLVAFGADAAALGPLAELRPLARAPERFAVTGEAAYLHAAGGLLESPLGRALLGKAGRAVTTRNWATVLKLAALSDSPPRT